MQQLDGRISQGYEEDDLDMETGWYPEEEEIETVTIYYYADQPARPRRTVSDAAIVFIALAVLIGGITALCFMPTSPAYTVVTRRVPAQITPLTLQASVQIAPTGTHNYPATQASGVLTIYNGSFLAESLPAHFILTASNGVEVITDQRVTIPAGNPPVTYGTASVTAHAAADGVGGNIAALAVNQTYGSALYIKNLSAFTGGHDASTESYATSQDMKIALTTAREQLSTKQPIGLTTGPCAENVTQKALTLTMVWSCQYVTYPIPKDGEVISVKVSGDSVLLSVRIITRPSVSHTVR